MQDPRTELPTIITLLTATPSPDIQRLTLRKFYTADAAFCHPLCRVAPGPNSRERILGIYQWYRVMSPQVRVEVREVVWDQSRGNGEGAQKVYVEAEQWFGLRFSPFQPAPAKLTVRLTLREEGGLYYIASQEDFYHSTDLTSILLPPLTPLIAALLSAAAVVSNINARVASLFGVWRVGAAVKQDGPSEKDGERGGDRW